MTSLALMDGHIELLGQRVARLLPGLAPTLVHRLEEIFDALDEDAATIAELEDRVAQLQARLAAPAPGGASREWPRHLPLGDVFPTDPGGRWAMMIIPTWDDYLARNASLGLRECTRCSATG